MTQTDQNGLRRFAELVSAYGARPEAWPRAERGWARSFMHASPEARSLLAGATEVDFWLDSLIVPKASAELEARVLASSPVLAQIPRRPRPAFGLENILAWVRRRAVAQPLLPLAARPVYAVAAAAVAGLLLGWGGVFSQPPAGEEEEIVAMAFVGGGLERYDLGEWQ